MGEQNTKQQKINVPRGSYLFLGMPESGKTVFFTMLCNILQRKGNEDSRFIFEYIPRKNDCAGSNSTYQYINSNLNCIKEQKWPHKTATDDKTLEVAQNPYICELSIARRFLCIPWKNSYSLCYIDYPGEAFQSAFCPNGEYEGVTDKIKNFGYLLRNTVNMSKGVFLIIDVQIFTNLNANEKAFIEERLSSFFLHVRKNNPSLRVAIVFNKMELCGFSNQEEEVQNQFQNQFSNAYAAMKQLQNKKMFFVYPFGQVETDSKGNTIPPKQPYAERNIESVAEWIFNIKSGSLTPKSENDGTH